MFDLMFGNYLLGKGLLTTSQLESALSIESDTRKKLSLLAVTKGFMTAEQADYINSLQKAMDRRFGELAIASGYLTEGQLTELIQLQKNGFFVLTQVLIDQQYMTQDSIDNALASYRIEKGLNDEEFESFVNDDIEYIIDFLFKGAPELIKMIAVKTINLLLRMISANIRLDTVKLTHSYKFDYLAYQISHGSQRVFCGIGGLNNSLLEIASPFAREQFTFMEDDVLDSVAEFINNVTGTYAAELCDRYIELEFTPPETHNHQSLLSEGVLYILPIYINDNHIDLIFTINSDTNFGNT